MKNKSSTYEEVLFVLLFFLMLYGLSSALALFLTLGLAFLLLHLVVDAPSDGTAQHYDDEDDNP